jgi:hypothetical protein
LAFCPSCRTLLKPSWLGPICKGCGFTDWAKSPWGNRLGFVGTSSGLAFACLARALKETGLRLEPRWPFPDPYSTFDVIPKHYPSVTWNSSKRVRRAYYDRLCSIDHPRARISGEGLEPLSWPLNIAREECLADLKVAIYGVQRAAGEFDPLREGSDRQLYCAGADEITASLVYLATQYPSRFVCENCYLIACGSSLGQGELITVDGCRDCLGTRQSYPSAMRAAMAASESREPTD